MQSRSTISSFETDSLPGTSDSISTGLQTGIAKSAYVSSNLPSYPVSEEMANRIPMRMEERDNSKQRVDSSSNPYSPGNLISCVSDS